MVTCEKFFSTKKTEESTPWLNVNSTHSVVQHTSKEVLWIQILGKGIGLVDNGKVLIEKVDTLINVIDDLMKPEKLSWF